jgi:hypothetical protein
MGTPRKFRATRDDTWDGLCTRYGVQEEDLRNLNEVGPAVDLPLDRDLYVPSRYTIKDGDTLSELAETYGIGQDQLQRVNRIPDANTIYGGNTMLVPAMDWDTAAPAQPDPLMQGLNEKFGGGGQHSS